MASRKSRYLIEHQRRVAHFSLINVDEAADFLFGLGALDDFQFAGCLNAADPVAQILIGHVQSPVCRGPPGWLLPDMALPAEAELLWSCKGTDYPPSIREQSCTAETIGHRFVQPA